MSTLPHLPRLALPTHLLIPLIPLILSLSAVHAHALTADAHTHLPQQQQQQQQQQQYNPPSPNAALDSNPAQIPLPLPLPLPLPPVDDPAADADAEGPQTQPKVRRCGWEIMEDGEFPFSLFPFSFSLYLLLSPFSPSTPSLLRLIPTNRAAGETSMAHLGALYAAQTGDTSQCVDVVGGVGGVSSNMSKKGRNRNRNRNRDGRTSGEVKTTTSAGLEKTGANTTFCACVFETCGNGVWVRDADDDGDEGSGEVASREDEEEAWEYVKACQKYCHAGTCV
jgi:hypothetical protein